MGWVNGDGGFPAYLWYAWPEPQRLAKISFGNPRKIGFGRSARQFSVVATQDCQDRQWVSLLYVGQAGFTAVSQTKAWWIPREKRGLYHCYGLKIMSSVAGRGKNDQVLVRNVKMWSYARVNP